VAALLIVLAGLPAVVWLARSGFAAPAASLRS
jgi:hypothetical protein